MAVAAIVENKIKRFIALAKKDIQINAVYLFGSTAREQNHEWSDIDLAIVSHDFSGDSFEDSKRLFPYILKVDFGIEAHPFRPEDFISEDPFVKEILTTGIRVA